MNSQPQQLRSALRPRAINVDYRALNTGSLRKQKPTDNNSSHSRSNVQFAGTPSKPSPEKSTRGNKLTDTLQSTINYISESEAIQSPLRQRPRFLSYQSPTRVSTTKQTGYELENSDIISQITEQESEIERDLIDDFNEINQRQHDQVQTPRTFPGSFAFKSPGFFLKGNVQTQVEIEYESDNENYTDKSVNDQLEVVEEAEFINTTLNNYENAQDSSIQSTSVNSNSNYKSFYRKLLQNSSSFIKQKRKTNPIITNTLLLSVVFVILSLVAFRVYPMFYNINHSSIISSSDANETICIEKIQPAQDSLMKEPLLMKDMKNNLNHTFFESMQQKIDSLKKEVHLLRANMQRIASSNSDESFSYIQSEINQFKEDLKAAQIRYSDIPAKYILLNQELMKLKQASDLEKEVLKSQLSKLSSRMKNVELSDKAAISPQVSEIIQTKISIGETRMKEAIEDFTDNKIKGLHEKLNQIVTKMSDQDTSIQIQAQLIRDISEHLKTLPVQDEAADYALESSGARIIRSLTSSGLSERHWFVIEWVMRILNDRKIQGKPPSIALSKDVNLGSQSGFLGIRLAKPMLPTTIKLTHVSKKSSFSMDNLTSAPKTISIWAVFNRKLAKEYIQSSKNKDMSWENHDVKSPPALRLQSGVYDIHAESHVQEFKVRDFAKLIIKEMRGVEDILVEITDNWGNTHYTCIYRVAVYGQDI